MSSQCYVCGAPKERCANISRPVPFSLYDDAETVTLKGEITFYCDGSEPDIHYFSPRTGQRCEDINQCFAGWSARNEHVEEAWANLRQLHAEDEDFLERQGLYLMESAPDPRLRVYVTRLHCQTRDGDAEVIYRGEYVDAEDVEPVNVTAGFIPSGSGASMWEVPLPACPDCGGALVWRENGYVPGARECQGCRSMFMLHSEQVADLRGPKPTTVMDTRVSLLLDNATNQQLPEQIRARLRELWQRRNACPDVAVPGISTMMIERVWPFAGQQEGK